MTGETYLELKKVSKGYKNIQAVDELSFKVMKGDIYGFLGPNGAGKSTSIRMILSLVRPDSGKIELFGRDLAIERTHTLSRVGALIEKPDFYNYLSARKNLEILARISGMRNYDERIDSVLELVKLSGRAHSKVKTFSQGMKQRLGIAQAILHEPDLIILDEPGNGLDPQGQKEMRDLIIKLNREEGITILISSHILSEIEQVANRMIIINKGKEVIEGEVEDLLFKQGNKFYLEVSDTEKCVEILNKSLPDSNPKIINGSKVRLLLKKEEVSSVVTLLVNNKLELYAVYPAKSLEDYFLSKTEDEYAG